MPLMGTVWDPKHSAVRGPRLNGRVAWGSWTGLPRGIRTILNVRAAISVGLCLALRVAFAGVCRNPPFTRAEWGTDVPPRTHADSKCSELDGGGVKNARKTPDNAFDPPPPQDWPSKGVRPVGTAAYQGIGVMERLRASGEWPSRNAQGLRVDASTPRA